MAPQTLKPDVKKAFIFNIAKVGIAALVIIIIVVILQVTVGLNVFIELMDMLGLQVQASSLLIWMSLVILLIAGALTGLNWIILRDVRYEFYEDKLICFESKMLVLIHSFEIPFSNITRIRVDQGSFLDSLLDTGSLFLELSAMDKKEQQIEFIDDVQNVANAINQWILNFRAKQSIQIQSNMEINEILNQDQYTK